MGDIRLYEAERATEWSAKADTALTEREAQRLATQAVKWLRTKGYVVPRDPKVTLTRGGGSYAWRGSGAIHLGRERPYRWILLHEIAHLVSHAKRDMPGWDGDEDTRSHGRAFMVVYLHLVGHYCGTADKRALMDECRKLGVKYRPRRRLNLTDAERADRAARLAKARPPASPHRYAYRRLVETTSGPLALYVSSRRGDTAQWVRPDRNGFSVNYGVTTRPERALTRTTPERLAATAARDAWWISLDDGYEVVDIAEIVLPFEQAAAERKAAAAKAAADKDRAARLRRELIDAARGAADPDRLEAALAALNPDADRRAAHPPE